MAERFRRHHSKEDHAPQQVNPQERAARLREAMKHLKAAGFDEMAKCVGHAMGKMLSERSQHSGHRERGTPGQSTHQYLRPDGTSDGNNDDLRAEVQRLSRQVEELANNIRQLEADPFLDQQQLRYDGGRSARTLPGYTVWQSFTPSVTGTLTAIGMGFFNAMSGDGQLQIFSGEGTTGTVLQTLVVPVFGRTQKAVTWNTWAVSVPVQAGQLYTFRLNPNATTLPDPYGVAIGAGNPYLDGVLGSEDPSGSHCGDFDAVFRIYVKPASAVTEHGLAPRGERDPVQKDEKGACDEAQERQVADE